MNNEINEVYLKWYTNCIIINNTSSYTDFSVFMRKCVDKKLNIPCTYWYILCLVLYYILPTVVSTNCCANKVVRVIYEERLIILIK